MHWPRYSVKGMITIVNFSRMNRILQIKFFSSIFISFCLVFGVITVSASASAEDDINHADFWLGTLQNPDVVIMNAKQIKKYNQEMLKKLPNTNYDFRKYPKTMRKKDLQNILQVNQFPEGYVNGQKMSLDFKLRMLTNLNLADIQAKNPVHYGIVVRRSSLRLYPTTAGVFEDEVDRTFDLLQATILNPGEGVAILHKSADNKWIFVQSATYRGWIVSDDVAQISDQEWGEWQNTKDFLVVVAARLNIQMDAETILLEMGSRLPVVRKEDNNYIVKVPQRQENGQVFFVEKAVPADENVNFGDLPYTRANIIKQAFKFYGQPYGWGGLSDSVDCSSFVMDIYRCFGFMMPRDADTQEVAVGKVRAVNSANVENVLKQTLPGATLHMDGHVMLYLGSIDGRYYVINSLGSYGASGSISGSDGLLMRVPVMQVVTTDIKNTLRRNGKSFMDSLRTVKEWQY